MRAVKISLTSIVPDRARGGLPLLLAFLLLIAIGGRPLPANADDRALQPEEIEISKIDLEPSEGEKFVIGEPIAIAVTVRPPFDSGDEIVHITLRVSPRVQLFDAGGISPCVKSGSSCSAANVNVRQGSQSKISARTRISTKGIYTIIAEIDAPDDSPVGDHRITRVIRVEDEPRSVCAPGYENSDTLGQTPYDRSANKFTAKIFRSWGGVKGPIIFLLMIPIAMILLRWRYPHHPSPAVPYLSVLGVLLLLVFAGAVINWNNVGKEDQPDSNLTVEVTGLVRWNGFVGVEGLVRNMGIGEARWRSDYGRGAHELHLLDADGGQYNLVGVEGGLGRTQTIAEGNEIAGWWYFRPSDGVCIQPSRQPDLNSVTLKHLRFPGPVKYP